MLIQIKKVRGELAANGSVGQPAYVAATSISLQINLMEYRGVRYAIRIGIKRGQWQLAIYLPDKELPEERPVVGTRQDAEIAAHLIIDAWMKKQFHKLQAR